MSHRNLFLIGLIGAVTLLFLVQVSHTCNEMVCASIVTKCMLTQSCKCNQKNCTYLAMECKSCLNTLFSECCSCVEMCPKPNSTKGYLSSRSHVEDLEEIAGLFSALTVEPDDDKWHRMTFPLDFDTTLFGSKQKFNMYTQTADQDLETLKKQRENIVTMNCTVVFMNQCLSWNKCKMNCLSMGASSYRWFHDGCCECVGSNCINYGINYGKCKYCPTDDIDPDDMPNEDDLDYGEGMGPLDNTDPNDETYTNEMTL